jgi:hypothetical protein
MEKDPITTTTIYRDKDEKHGLEIIVERLDSGCVRCYKITNIFAHTTETTAYIGSEPLEVMYKDLTGKG